MEMGQPSRTAENTAVMRALPPEERVFDDPIATQLVHSDSDAYRSRLSLLAGLSDSVRSRFTQYILRSRYTEDCLTEAVQQRGISQYVNLGAGLNTFAYRQPTWAQRLRIFEVDHPATQDWKRGRLKAAGIAVPKNVSFVPVDFDETTLSQGLVKAGRSQTAATFFSMLGVSQYLTEEALDRTFDLVLQMPRSSEIVVSINPPEETLRPDDAALFSELTRRFAAIGEPWLTRPLPDQFGFKLNTMGFRRAQWIDI